MYVGKRYAWKNERPIIWDRDRSLRFGGIDMKKIPALILFLSLCTWLSASEAAGPASGTSDGRADPPPFRVCVLDFVQADIVGQNRFLDQNSQPVVIPPQCTMGREDRMSINAVMQGYVRMIDAQDAARTNEANRMRMFDDNQWERTKALELYQTAVKGQFRPVILGSDQLSALLSRHSDVFACTDASLMEAAMQQLQYQQDFPVDFQRKLADMTGATHLLCGTVADLRISSKTFQGYGIETTTTRYELDFSYKLVDLRAQRTVYGGIATGVYTERKRPGVIEQEPSLFQNLLNEALRKTADELYRACKPGKDCKVPPPAAVPETVVPPPPPPPAAVPETAVPAAAAPKSDVRTTDGSQSTAGPRASAPGAAE